MKKKGMTHAEQAKLLGPQPWDRYSETYKGSLIKDLLKDWPSMDREDRIIASAYRPRLVEAAGLEPVYEGPEDIERYEKYGYPPAFGEQG